jgi:glycosyltransferase involved in cell wall biosynthesis
MVDIVVPVYNEAHVLAASVERLHRYLAEEFPFTWRIVIADNGSTDRTWEVATQLAGLYDHVSALHLDQKGRGRALRAAWSTSDAWSSPTWTWICPQICVPCCRWWHRWCRGTPTSPSGRGSHPEPVWCADRVGS